MYSEMQVALLSVLEDILELDSARMTRICGLRLGFRILVLCTRRTFFGSSGWKFHEAGKVQLTAVVLQSIHNPADIIFQCIRTNIGAFYNILTWEYVYGRIGMYGSVRAQARLSPIYDSKQWQGQNFCLNFFKRIF